MTADGCVWCSSPGCGSQHDCHRYSATCAERRRHASMSVVGPSSQTADRGRHKRPSATSCQSAPPVTDNVDQLPGIHIQHIEALPYNVAVLTTGCRCGSGSGGDGGHLSRRSGDGGSAVHDCSRSAAAESDNSRRYIVIHNELSSASSLSRSRSRSRSSKASSVNMNDVSSFESDTDPTNVTMATTSATAAAASGRRYSTRQVM